MTDKVKMNETKDMRKWLARFMDGLFKFKNPLVEALDRTFWRGFFYGLFFFLGKYYTTGLKEHLGKVLEYLKNEDYNGFDEYVGGLLDEKIDIPFIEDSHEKEYFVKALSFLNSTIKLAVDKVNSIAGSAEGDDPILSNE